MAPKSKTRTRKSKSEGKPAWNWMSRGNGGYFITQYGKEITPDEVVSLLNQWETVVQLIDRLEGRTR